MSRLRPRGNFGSLGQGEAPGRAPPVGDSDGDGSGGDAGGGVGGLLGSIMGTISKTHKGVADTATGEGVDLPYSLKLLALFSDAIPCFLCGSSGGGFQGVRGPTSWIPSEGLSSLRKF